MPHMHEANHFDLAFDKDEVCEVQKFSVHLKISLINKLKHQSTTDNMIEILIKNLQMNLNLKWRLR